ncbi:MAG: hypothetical protein HY791_02950 [Deltaproteobacteria bacterium]|nr:hypothetical protein [Deltaproteobacteria bacterium]
MSGQQSYSLTQQAAYAGMRHGLFDHRCRTFVNDKGAVRQIDTITVDTAVGSSTTYALTVDGYSISFTSASASKTVIRDGLIAAGRAVQALESVCAFNPSGTDALTVTAATEGTGFTTAESDGNLSLANTVANVAKEPIPFGRGVVRRRTLASSTVTVDTAANSTAYAMTIDGVSVSITSDASATKTEIRDALIAEAYRLMGPGLGLYHLRDRIKLETVSTDALKVTKLSPGLAITVAESDANLSIANTAASQPTNADEKSAALPGAAQDEFLFVGIVERIHSNVDPTNASASYPDSAVSFGQDMSVIEQGPVWVEVTGAVSAGDQAYCYFSGATVVGKFTNGPTSSTAFPVEGTFDSSTTGAGLAVLNLKKAA